MPERDGKADQEKLLRAFLRDVTEFHRQTPVDLVVFSGDLAFAAQPDEFDFARRALLDPLQTALGQGKYQEKGLLAGLTSRDAVNRLLDGDGPTNYLERMEPWLAFHAEYYDGTAVRRRSPLVTEHRLTVDGVEVAVACLTSAWRATGEGDDADRAHLIVRDRQAAAAGTDGGPARTPYG